MMRYKYLLTTCLGLMFVMSLSLSAQENQIITVALPQFWEMLFDESLFDEFEAQYNVTVQPVYSQEQPTTLSEFDNQSITDWQDDLQKYVQSADVLFVDNSIISPEVTRANMILNLNPLIQADSFLNPADFYPAIWNSFAWDGSQWALPIAGSTTLVEYTPSAFDEAGLVYPSVNWSLREFGDSARSLTEYDEDGNVSLPGMLISPENRSLFLYSLSQQAFHDDSQPDMPQFNVDALTPLFELWKELEDEGVIVSDIIPYIQRLNEIPIKVGVGGFFAITVEAGDENTEEENSTGFDFDENALETTLVQLPNAVGGVDAQGFAVSSGTENPQLAYDLTRYISAHPNFAGFALGAEPARRMYDMPEMEADDNGVSVFVGGASQRSEADISLIQSTLETGISAPDLRFGHYLSAVDSHIQAGTDPASAIQLVEADANNVVTQMMQTDRTIIVDAPKQIIVPEGEFLLQFGIASFVQPLPNQIEWDRLAQEFADNDPEVGAIQINSGFMQANQMLRQNDCIYQPTIIDLFQLDTSQLLAIDPLLNADITYTITELPLTTLEQLQRNGITYGLPLTLQPELLVYDKKAFEAMGIQLTLDNWTMTEFENLLRQLDDNLDESAYPLETVSPVNTHLLMLIAAQGGRLFDTSTTPITLDFTSPQSINATMQVLDLIKAQQIKYEKLGESAGFDFVAMDGDAFDNIQANNFLGFFDDSLGLLPYPQGNQYTPIALNVGAGFISTESAYPEACYRWLSYLANNPSAFTDMPALLSTLDQPAIQSAIGADRLAVYQTVANQSAQPNAINPIVWDPIIMLWLNRAFDAYIFDDADLSAELLEAEQFTQSYVDCLNLQPDEDLSEADLFERIGTCAEQLGIE